MTRTLLTATFAILSALAVHAEASPQSDLAQLRVELIPSAGKPGAATVNLMTVNGYPGTWRNFKEVPYVSNISQTNGAVAVTTASAKDGLELVATVVRNGELHDVAVHVSMENLMVQPETTMLPSGPMVLGRPVTVTTTLDFDVKKLAFGEARPIDLGAGFKALVTLVPPVSAN